MSFPFGPKRRGTLHNTFPPGGRYGAGSQVQQPKQMSSEISKDTDTESKEGGQKQAE